MLGVVVRVEGIKYYIQKKFNGVVFGYMWGGVVCQLPACAQTSHTSPSIDDFIFILPCVCLKISFTVVGGCCLLKIQKSETKIVR